MKKLLLLGALACAGYSITAAADTSQLTPKCKVQTTDGDAACWMKLQNKSDCWVWNWYPGTNETVTWSGLCKAGQVDGKGKLVWNHDGGEQVNIGPLC